MDKTVIGLRAYRLLQAGGSQLKLIFSGAMMLLASAAQAADLTLYAAGSLRPAMTAMIEHFFDETGIHVKPDFGPSGSLRKKMEGGDVPDIFASANLEHPKALQDVGILKETVVFATNRLCVLAAPGVAIDRNALLAQLLDPGTRMAVATPVIDPAGDYTWEMFRKADVLQPGAFDALRKKGLQILAQPAKDGSPLGVIGVLQKAKADMVLAYCSYGKLAEEKVPGATWMPLPTTLDVPSQYGIGIATHANPLAGRFVQFVRSARGQAILSHYGFSQ